MSAGLVAGTYKIVSVVQDPRSGAGIFGELRGGIDFVVHNNADYTTWVIKELGGTDLFHFALKDIRPYTGVDGEGNVIVTEKEKENKEWRVRYYPERGAFTIELPDLRPSRGWTLSSEEPGAKIEVHAFVVPDDKQLFTFVSVPE